MRAMYMEFDEAVEHIGNALVSLGGSNAYLNQEFPYPDVMTVLAGKPTITARWDGIAEDGDPIEGIVVPKSFRFEIRIYHPFYAPADRPELNPNNLDGFEFAQKMILDGTSAFYPALARDRQLDGLVLSTVLEGSITGDLEEPRTREVFYGHEMLLTTTMRL